MILINEDYSITEIYSSHAEELTECIECKNSLSDTSNAYIPLRNKLIGLPYRSVRKKMANAIAAFAKNNKGVNDQDRLSISVSSDDLATMAGTAIGTLIRTLSDFKSEGFIAIDEKTMKIHDLAELDQLIA